LRTKDFLLETLKLRLSEEKTHITNARAEKTHFLGTNLKVGSGGTPNVVLTTNGSGKRFKRRSTGWETVMQAPLSKLIRRLRDKGMCSIEGRPLAKRGWAFLDAEQIVALYSSVNHGIQNYYRFADNWSRLSRIQSILQSSLAKTLALKFQITTSQVFKKLGKDMCIKAEGKDGKKDREVRFYLNHDWSKNREAFQQGTHTNIDQLRISIGMRTRSKLGKPCCICGATGDVMQIAMHHVRHIRKLSSKRKAVGFNGILQKLNRKPIPVCEECHGKIHRGAYDGLKLSNLAYLPK
jgi:nicotine oxidoreductase